MPQRKIPAAFIRGGASKGVFFHERDLPKDPKARDAIFLEVLGSPDPYQRQLNGLGGGLSSLSKIVIVKTSDRDDADVDYTFGQVSVDQPVVAYDTACGSLSAAVGAFAIDEGLIAAPDGEARVRVYMTNVDKHYHARFPVKDGRTVETGAFTIPGVAGGGAPVALDYQEPGGAITGSLLPSGRVRDTVEVAGIGPVEVSMVDASNALSFVRAEDLGCTGTELPDELEAKPGLLDRLDSIRRQCGVLMRLANRPEDVGLANPKVVMVSRPADFVATDGTRFAAADHDIATRVVSMGRINRTSPVTGAMCTGIAARIEGTIPHELATAGSPIRVANPAGLFPIEADVVRNPDGSFQARSVTVFSTQRRLMEGFVLVNGA